jgi:hypothetical protein
MGHHMMGGHSNSNAGRNYMMMHSWGQQHMHMPLMMHPGANSSPPGGYMMQPGGNSSNNRGSWQPQNPKAGGYGGGINGYGGGSNGRYQGGSRGPMQGGRGNRGRRHAMLNTSPGKQQDLASISVQQWWDRGPGGWVDLLHCGVSPSGVSARARCLVVVRGAVLWVGVR